MRNFLALMLLAGPCCLVFAQEARAEVDTTGQVNKDDTALTMFWGHIQDDGFGSLDATYEGYFPYDPNADYTIEVWPSLIPKIRHDYGDTYEDYYNYIQWTSGDSVYYPYYFSFTGPGPDVEIDYQS